MIKVNFVIIRGEDLEALHKFYTNLGIDFKEEKHGNGPIHFSAELGDIVLELYRGKPTKQIVVGINVDNFEIFVDKAKLHGATIEMRDGYAILSDIAGNKLIVTENHPNHT